MRVIALDPGITTGYAIGNVKDKKLEFVCGEARWDHKELYEWLDRHDPDVIVYETFEYRNRQRDGLVLFSKELIGVINLYAGMTSGGDDVILVSQHPSAVVGKTSYFSAKKLKEHECYYPNSEHPRDATRHLLHWWWFGAGSQYADLEARKVPYARDYIMTGIVK